MEDGKGEPVEKGVEAPNRPDSQSCHREGQTDESRLCDPLRAIGKYIEYAAYANAKSNDEKRDTHDRVMLFTSCGSFIFLLIYTVVTIIGVYVTVQSNRAYVTNIRLELTDTKDDRPGAARWFIGPLVKNSGNTPTRNLRSVVRLIERRLGEKSLIEDPDSGFIEDHDSVHRQYTFSRFTISPGTQTAIVDFGISRDHHAEIVKARGDLVFIGSIRYNDVFPWVPEHVTKYCYSMMAVGINNDGSSFPISARCPYWNCTDDQCDDDKRAYEAELSRIEVRMMPIPPP